MQGVQTFEKYVFKADPDRALCASFLPEPARQNIFLLLAFHDEITRALVPGRSATIAGPMAAYVRLQWWRDVLEGTRPPEHELAPLLLSALQAKKFRTETVTDLLEARESELSAEGDPSSWAAMMLKGSGGLQRAVGEALGITDAETLDGLAACGAAYGAGAMLRHWPVLQKAGGRYLFPGEADGLRQAGLVFLAEAEQKIARGSLAAKAALPAVLARRDLQRDSNQAGRPRGLGDKCAVIAAGLKTRWSGNKT